MCPPADQYVLQVAVNQASPRGIATGTSHVYWVNHGDGRLLSSPLGQNLPFIERSGLVAPHAIAVAGTSYAYTELGPPGAVTSTLALAAVVADQDEPVSVKFLGAYEFVWGDTGDGTVRVGNPVSDPVLVADEQDPVALAASGLSIFWVNESLGTVVSCSLSDCDETGPLVLASEQDAPHAIALDADAVYWATPSEIYKCPRAGCGELPPIRLATGLKPRDIAVFDGEIYFTDRECNAVLKCPVTGCDGDMTALADGLDRPDRIAVEAERAYWTNEDGRVLATAR